VAAALTFGIPATGITAALEIGDPAPDFRLPNVDGNTYTLADFADARVLVIIFTCNHCPTAQAYEERMNALVEDYGDKGVAVVAISPNDPKAVRLDELGYTDVGDSFEDMKLRAEDQDFRFPYLYDGDTQEVSRAYAPVATPHVFIFDRERKLRYAGRIDNNAKPQRVTSHDTRDAIDALLADKPVPVEKTKTFGCSIKWSDKRSSVKASLQKWAQEEATLKTIDKEAIAEFVKNDSEKLRLINLWATWCGPCLSEFPDLVTMHRMYRRRDFELITISADPPEQKEQALKFLKEQHASCQNYIFESEDVYQLVDVVDKEWPGALPYTLLVAPGGKILYRKHGENDPLEVRRAIVEHLGRVYK
jgi:peroxiredoxin